MASYTFSNKAINIILYMLNFVLFFLLVPQSLTGDRVILCRHYRMKMWTTFPWEIKFSDSLFHIWKRNESFNTACSGSLLAAIYMSVCWVLLFFFSLLENRKMVENKDSKCKDKNGMVLTQDVERKMFANLQW